MEITTHLAAARLEPMTEARVSAASPDAAATQQFAALMQAPAPGTTAVDEVAQQTSVGAFGSVGDKILNGMQSVSNDFRVTWKQVSDTLHTEGAEITMQEMLSLQLSLTQASVQYDLLGKAVSRSTQNFDQLVRVQ